MSRIRIILIAIFLLMAICSVSLAAEYYVDGSNGQDANPGSLKAPWKTITKANATVKPGDTVFIKKGTYRQTIRPEQSGTKDNYITYKNYSNDEVTITGVDGADLKNRSYVVVDGLRFYKTTRFVDMKPNGHHNIIQNCYMEEASTYVGIRLRVGANYNKILNNIVIGKCGPNDLIQIFDSSHNLVDGNEFYYGPHDAIDIQDETDGTTNYNIIRNNYIENKIHSNIDIWGVEYLLLENNIIVDGGQNYKENACGSERDRTMARNEHKGIMVGGKHSIYRNNVLINNGTGISLPSGTVSWKGCTINQRIYHNTLYKNYEGFRIDGDPGAWDNVFKNNIVYNSVNYTIRRYGKDVRMENYYISNNLLGPNIQYGSKDTVKGNLSLNPLFTNENERDLSLRENSPMINKGAFLTKTTTSGNGRTISVEDARYFMDGWGIVEGDLIQLQGQTVKVRITSIDYNANKITIDRPLEWSKGLGISLPYYGSAPDIGAIERIEKQDNTLLAPVNLRFSSFNY